MDGIIVLNKPLNISSHDCVNILRRTLGTKKIGHAGTLDKEASGVLVLGVNKGTKIMPYLNQDDKGYEFSVVFNQETDTLDHCGTIIKETSFDSFATIDEVIESFKGNYHQIPPSYSAVKVKGKKLYEYARNNESMPNVKPRALTIFEFKRTSEIHHKSDGTVHIDLYVKGSKGLYVRKLALDLAKALGTVAHTKKIHRVLSGTFKIEEANTLNDIKNETYTMLSLNDAIRSLSTYTIQYNDISKETIFHGKQLRIDAKDDLLKIIDQDETLLAIYKKVDIYTYKPDKVFIEGV